MRKSFVSRTFGFLPFALLAGTSCSLVYDLSPDQCGSNDDCAHFGPGLVCSDGICTCGDPSVCGSGASGGSGAKGGNGGKGGTSFVGGTGGTIIAGAAGATDVGGTSNGGTSGTGAKGGTSSKGGSSNGGTSNGGTTGGTTTSGTGGGGGVPEVPECTTNADCATIYASDYKNNPRACIDGTCKELLSTDCPFLLPLKDKATNWNALRSTDAIILGAFAPVTSTTSLNTYSRNIDLPATELYQETQGVYSGSSKKRQVMFVLCNDYYGGDQAPILDNAKHLINDLHVPGIVSTLFLEDQKYIWENIASQSGTFLLMPLTSDEDLIDTQDDGLIWHMLSGANALSVSYQPLFDMTLDHLRTLTTPGPALGMTEDVKVSQVVSDDQFNLDTGKYLEAHLQFNNKTVSENLDAGLYDAVGVVSDVHDPSDTQADAIERILSFGPHIVLATGTTETLKYIIPGVEAAWDTRQPGRQRPFYLMGSMVYNDGELTTLVKNAGVSSPPLYQRILGINWPAAVDQTIYDAYQARWKMAYGVAEPGYENFYDATYYLMYALAGARPPFTGKTIRDGMARVTSTLSSSPVAAVGPNTDMDTYIPALGKDSTTIIQLVGAGGPPNWDQYGGRNDAGSVWCVNTVGVFHPDELRYDKSSSSLQGYIDCFPFDGMQPPTP